MVAEDLTLDGMLRGIRDSDVLLLILTKNVLSSWYCRQVTVVPGMFKEKTQTLPIHTRTRMHRFEHFLDVP